VRAGKITDGAQRMTGTADALLHTYEPIARKAAPLAEKFVDNLSEEEVEAAIKLVDELPRLTEHLRTDILPILDTLGSVAPDLRDLLEASKELNEIITSIPGLSRKRSDE